MHVKLEKNAVLVGQTSDVDDDGTGVEERAVFRAMPDTAR
jgi:hypothetical protein